MLHRVIARKQRVYRSLPVPPLDQGEESHISKVDSKERNSRVRIRRPNHQTVAPQHNDRVDRSIEGQIGGIAFVDPSQFASAGDFRRSGKVAVAKDGKPVAVRLDIEMTFTYCLLDTPIPLFSMSVTPTARTVIRGGSPVTYTVNLTSLNTFSGTVNLSVSGLPNKTSGSFNPVSVLLSSGSGSSTLTISAERNGPTGTFTITIIGTATDPRGTFRSSQTVTLTVTR